MEDSETKWAELESPKLVWRVKNMIGTKFGTYKSEVDGLLNEIMSILNELRGSQLWFYFKSMIPESEGTPDSGKEVKVNEMAALMIQVSKNLEKLVQTVEDSSEILEIHGKINIVEENITKLRRLLERRHSRDDFSLKERAQFVSTHLDDLREQLAVLLEVEKKIDLAEKRRLSVEKGGIKESDKLKMQKLRDSLNSIGLTIDDITDPNKIMDRISSNPLFLKAVRDRLAQKGSSDSPIHGVAASRLIACPLLAIEQGGIEERMKAFASTVLHPNEEGFLLLLEEQLNSKCTALNQTERVVNAKIRIAEEEERYLLARLERTKSSILDLKMKKENMSKDWKTLESLRKKFSKLKVDFHRLSEANEKLNFNY